ncbi:MAG: hypothetical protein ABW128_15445 [Rhizorhabdus sp.]
MDSLNEMADHLDREAVRLVSQYLNTSGCRYSKEIIEADSFLSVAKRLREMHAIRETHPTQ